MVDGERFDSKREATRWGVLLLREKAGEIRDLKRQPVYPLLVGVVKVGVFRADFEYRERGVGFDRQNWVLVTEDSKGYRTQVYKLKARMFQAQYGYAIRET